MSAIRSFERSVGPQEVREVRQVKREKIRERCSSPGEKASKNCPITAALRGRIVWCHIPLVLRGVLQVVLRLG